MPHATAAVLIFFSHQWWYVLRRQKYYGRVKDRGVTDQPMKQLLSNLAYNQKEDKRTLLQRASQKWWIDAEIQQSKVYPFCGQDCEG